MTARTNPLPLVVHSSGWLADQEKKERKSVKWEAVDASTDEGELFKRMETTTCTTSPLDSEVHDDDVSTKKGIISTESPNCRFPGQEKKERKSVKWQVTDNAPERTGPWKSPKKRDISTRLREMEYCDPKAGQTCCVFDWLRLEEIQ
jgi:hypothetical protein